LLDFLTTLGKSTSVKSDLHLPRLSIDSTEDRLGQIRGQWSVYVDKDDLSFNRWLLHLANFVTWLYLLDKDVDGFSMSVAQFQVDNQTKK